MIANTYKERSQSPILQSKVKLVDRLMSIPEKGKKTNKNKIKRKKNTIEGKVINESMVF